MFGSDVLDVAIGVTLLFLFASLICTAIQEAIESVMRWRAMDLERGIRELLQTEHAVRQNELSGDAAATARMSAQKFYDHPFIYGLFTGTYDAAAVVEGGRFSGASGHPIMPRAERMGLPTYIPSGSFAATIIDLVRLEVGPDAPLTFETLKAGAQEIQNPRLRQAVVAAVMDCEGDIGRLRKTFENWFDATMDRVSGWYKRRTQMILLTIGLVAAIVFNLDAIHVARHLATDKAYRQTVVAEAGAKDRAHRATAQDAAPAAGADAAPATPEPAISQAFAQARSDLDAGGFALGWPAPQIAEARRLDRSRGIAVLLMLCGWLVTALAVSLGAPFWFDVLNKFMVIRSTVKPAEKSGREGSKDGAAPRTDGNAPPRPAVAPVVMSGSPPASPGR